MKITDAKSFENPNETEAFTMREPIDTVNFNTIHSHKRHHIAPHERKNLIQIDFDDRDWKIFKEIFGDEDTANAVVNIIHNAPPEIQILAIQILKMIEEVA